MSSAERVVRLHRRQIDRAISQAYARLATHACALDAFGELLQCVRTRARRLLGEPFIGGRHPGVDALFNLSRYAGGYRRGIADWPGTAASWRLCVSGLAEHLLCAYTVPRFLGASWYAVGDAYAERKREWFVAHGRGARFRSLDLPIVLTSRMEHIFLASRDHLSVEHAMRRAELLALGASDALVRTVLATEPGTDLRHGAFWRTVWTFLIENEQAIDPAQVAPLIEFVHSVRHRSITVETPDGVARRDPPQPSFSMKGRTVPSMLRLMQDWHRSLGTTWGGLTWHPSPLRPMVVEEPGEDLSAPPAVWRMTELTSGEQLRAEGSALHHCVSSYADRCWRGVSEIWSLRVQRGDRIRPVLTVEVDRRRRAVVQARGWGNRLASGKSLPMLQRWALREQVRLAVF